MICDAVGKGRVRRHHARPARRDGDREPRGRRGRIAAPHPRDRPERRRSPCRSTCTPTSTTRSSTTRRSSPATAPIRISTPTTPPSAPARSCCGRCAARCRPVMAWGNVPMLPHVMRQGSDDHPNKELQARCAAMDGSEGALAASLFTGFPHADIANAGLSAVVVTDGDRGARRETARRIARPRLGRPRGFRLPDRAARTIAGARQGDASRRSRGEGPIVLLDHYDNCASGGTMDTTAVLAAILREGLENVAAFAIYDPEAVQQAIAAGIGAEVALVDRRQDRRCRRSPATAAPLDRDRHGQDDLERPLPQQGADGARRADGHGAERRARHRPRRDRADLAPCRAERPQLPAVARHRPDAEALS